MVTGINMISPLRYCTHIKHINYTPIVFNHPNVGYVFSGLVHCVNYSQDKKGCCKDIVQTTGKKVEPWPKTYPPTTPWRAECSHEPQPPNYDPYKIKVPDVVVPPLPASNVKPMLDCARQRGPCSLKPVPPEPPPPPPPPPPFPWIYLWALLSFFGAFGMAYKLYLWREMAEVASEKIVWRPRRKIRRPYHDRDLPPCVQYLIIGTGAAGWAAYRSIMQHDKRAKVFFVTKEDSVPYQRPPLSKEMWLNPDPPDPKVLTYIQDDKRKTMLNAECREFLDAVAFYRKKRGPAVSIASGWCVTRIDADDHVAYVKTLSGERPIYYERCLLAPGVKAKNLSIVKSAPKQVRERVCTLRTIRDFEIAYRKVKEANHVTVIGAGPLGCELAWHLGRMNKIFPREDTPPLELVHVYKDKGILSGILPEYLGVWASEHIKCEGVKLVPNAQVYDVFESKDGRLELTLSNGQSIVTDYAFVAIGAEPRIDLAEESFLERDDVNGGYLVNTELEARTHLYIAGDAASYYSQWKDTRLRTDHYINAEEQGFIAGANMTGYWIPCNMEPNFWVKLGDSLQMEVVGEAGACLPIVGLFKDCNDEESEKEAEKIMGPEEKRKCFINKKADYFNRYKRGLLFYLRDETVVGFAFWNMPPIEDRKAVATELLRAKPTYHDINLLAELLGFPGTLCVYPTAAEEIKKAGPCLKNVKKW
ncbi:apoptosis-inducing factor 1, mitochondrial isoform X2 [Spodoptera frugiperda]|uniref:Apoptosis-inducing factor 1, mitochondrial isoform X2 n=1 Tax=Spodoptera frugiperda TaxID=7108 RepID=A0A9R0ELC8_SPOFR|nr:apoptosis-inducing factor 1, mitochondrial isoform X2 [Spodoptera frugiperda]